MRTLYTTACIADERVCTSNEGDVAGDKKNQPTVAIATETTAHGRGRK